MLICYTQELLYRKKSKQVFLAINGEFKSEKLCKTQVRIALKEVCVQPTRNPYKFSVQVRGCTSVNGLGDLVRNSGNV